MNCFDFICLRKVTECLLHARSSHRYCAFINEYKRGLFLINRQLQYIPTTVVSDKLELFQEVSGGPQSESYGVSRPQISV